MTRSPVSGCVLRGPHQAAARTTLASLLGLAAGTPEKPWMWLFWRDLLSLPWTASQLVVELLALLSMFALVHDRCKRAAVAAGPAGGENIQAYTLKKKSPEVLQPDWDEASTVAGSPLSTVAGSPLRCPSTSSTSLPPTPLFSRLPSPMESDEMDDAQGLPPPPETSGLPDDIASYGPLGCCFASQDLGLHCLPSPTERSDAASELPEDVSSYGPLGCGFIAQDVC